MTNTLAERFREVVEASRLLTTHVDVAAGETA